MSFGRAAGPILATVCGVCTAYATFAPELQKQQTEREFQDQHGEGEIPPTKTEVEAQPPSQTVISNEESIGARVKDAIQETKTEAAPAKAWFGLSMFRGALGGDESPKANNDDEKRS